MNAEVCFDNSDTEENLIADLYCELNYVKQEHSNLKDKVSVLLKENDLLRKQYNDLLEEKLSCQAHDNALTENLKQQICNLTKEKEYATKLWQNCIKTIDVLEADIKTYQSGIDGFVSKRDISKLKSSYEEKILMLSSELSSTKERLSEMSKNSSNTLIAKFSEIDKSLEIQENSIKIITNLEHEILTLQQRLHESVQLRQNMEKQIKQQERALDDMAKRNESYIRKVKESIQIVEAALVEKDGALLREKECKDKIEELSSALDQYMKANDQKLNENTNLIKNSYEEKLKELNLELREKQCDITNKTSEIENMNLKLLQLQRDLDKLKQDKYPATDNDISKLLILEKNLESTFQKLLLSEKQNIALASQRDAIQNDMEEMSSHFERDIRTKEIEKAMLQNKISQVLMEKDDIISKSCKYEEEMKEAKNKLILMKKDFIDQIDCKERSLKAEMMETRKEYNKQIDELKSKINIQRNINQKWMLQTKSITDQLEKNIIDTKSKLQKCRKENKKLLNKLSEAKKKISEYSELLQNIMQDVNKITSLSVPTTGSNVN